MSDRDLLERAASTWRAQHGGECTSSGLTRARILEKLRQKQQRRRRLGWWFLAPVPLLVAGSAWAEATDAWPEVLQPVRAQVVALAQSVGLKRPPSAPSPPREAPPSMGVSVQSEQFVGPSAPSEQPAVPQARELTHPPSPGTAHAPSTDSAHLPSPGAAHLPSPGAAHLPSPGAAHAPSPDSAHLPSPGTAHLPSPGAAHAPSTGSKETHLPPTPRALGAVPAASSTVNPPREAPRDPELAALRQAHDAHFVSKSPARAKRAYQRYLAQYPSGRFVPEARYNLTLLQLRLGETRAAKPVLEAFARGAYGGYRQAEARALLDAIERHQPSGAQ